MGIKIYGLGAILLLLTGCGLTYFRDPSSETPVYDQPALIAETELQITDVLNSPAVTFSNEKVSQNVAKNQIIVTGTVNSQNGAGDSQSASFENVYVKDKDGNTHRRGMMIQNTTFERSYF